MQGTTTNHNANGVTPQLERQRKISASRKFHESRKITPTDMARPINRNMNGNVKHDLMNGKAKKVSTTSLDPKSFFEAATLLGSVGSLKAAETTERVRRGSTSHEEDVYKGFAFPFENLVFEGGGNKGMAYVGALQVCILMFSFVVLFVLTHHALTIRDSFATACLLSSAGKNFLSFLFWCSSSLVWDLRGYVVFV